MQVSEDDFNKCIFAVARLLHRFDIKHLTDTLLVPGQHYNSSSANSFVYQCWRNLCVECVHWPFWTKLFDIVLVISPLITNSLMARAYKLHTRRITKYLTVRSLMGTFAVMFESPENFVSNSTTLGKFCASCSWSRVNKACRHTNNLLSAASCLLCQSGCCQSRLIPCNVCLQIPASKKLLAIHTDMSSSTISL